jgi:signal transduction histidine kinase
MSLSLLSAPPDLPSSGTDFTNAASFAESRAARNPEQRSSTAAQRISALGEMTGGIAHDFRNVLAIIESGLTLAERNVADPETFHACLAAAQEGVERGLNLTSRLLAFAKSQELLPQPQDLNNLLQDLKLFLNYGAGSGIRILYELTPDLPSCLVDPPQFNAAILNLVVNARDAMPDGGQIRISSSAIPRPQRADQDHDAGTAVCVRIRDEGQGMPPAVMQRIFDPYFTTKGESGTGLGVPQVCAFMKSVGGHVRVSSEVGTGTQFELIFPAGPGLPPAVSGLSRQIDRWVNEGGSDRISAAVVRFDGYQGVPGDERDNC